MSGVVLEPLRHREQLLAYVDEHWPAAQVAARDPALLDFTYATPWVDRDRFPAGYSVLGAYRGDKLLAVVGAMVAPFPRPQSYWLTLTHVADPVLGPALAGRLLERLQDVALAGGGWIGALIPGPEAVDRYLALGYTVRAVRRWLYDPQRTAPPEPRYGTARHNKEIEPTADWIDFRFARHPRLEYEIRRGGVFRTETTAWGRVTHAVRLPAEAAPREVYEREETIARRAGTPYLMDAWAFEAPGPGWAPAAPEDRWYAVGLPFLPSSVHSGDPLLR